MQGVASRKRSPKLPPAEDGESGSDRLTYVLRHSHIFASVVRDILEIKFLQEVTTDSLSLSQFHLLKLIVLNGRHQVGEVADFLGVSAPAATKNIDKLEQLGLVARSASKQDRRATLLAASRKGRRLVAKYEALKARRLAPIFQHFSVEELEQLARLLERFSLCVIRQEDPSDGLCLRCFAYYDDHCPVMKIRDGCAYQKIRQSRVPDTSPVEA